MKYHPLIAAAGIGFAGCAGAAVNLAPDVDLKTLSVPGGTIAYRDSGRGNPVILIHAAGHDHHDFDSIAEKLKEKYRVLALDLPGHGRSSMPAAVDAATAMQMADAVEQFILKQTAEPVILIGNSVGGYSSVRFALRHPQMVRALVLVNSGGFHDPTFSGRMFTSLKGTEWFTSLMWNKFPETYLKQRNPAAEEILARIRMGKTDEAIALNASIWRSFNDPEHDLRAAAAKVNVPALLLWGESDPVIPGEIARKAVQIIPGAKLVLVNTGHSPFAEAPEEFLKHLTPFLESLP